jgi:L-asparaginase II
MRRHFPELSVTVRRGELVESRHRVHAVEVRDGRVLRAWGDPTLVAYVRSAAKPLQALPLVLAYPTIPDEELVIACASHGARPEQLELVEALLSRAGAAEADLECGPVDGSRLRHNCSGKHAGMLCVCAAHGWPRKGYRLPEHPLQSVLLGIVAEATELPRDGIATATDGCGVVTYALPLRAMADAYSRLVRDELDGSARIVEAMRGHPQLVEWSGTPATEVMLAVEGAVAKGGAEGVLCVGLPDGRGVACKVEDGTSRALGPAAGSLFDAPALAHAPVENSRGEEVGTIGVEAGAKEHKG